MILLDIYLALKTYVKYWNAGSWVFSRWLLGVQLLAPECPAVSLEGREGTELPLKKGLPFSFWLVDQILRSLNVIFVTLN